MTLHKLTQSEPELFDRNGVPEFWSLTPDQYRLLVDEVMRWRADPRKALRHAWKAEQARWGKTSPRFKLAVRQAYMRGHEWSLTPGDYEEIVTRPCAVCGSRTGKACGLDRIDHAIGYRRDNVRPCCGPCNIERGRRAIAI